MTKEVVQQRQSDPTLLELKNRYTAAGMNDRDAFRLALQNVSPDARVTPAQAARRTLHVHPAGPGVV